MSLIEPPDSAQAIVDPRDAAESAALRYVSDERPGIRRKKAGTERPSLRSGRAADSAAPARWRE